MCVLSIKVPIRKKKVWNLIEDTSYSCDSVKSMAFFISCTPATRVNSDSSKEEDFKRITIMRISTVLISDKDTQLQLYNKRNDKEVELRSGERVIYCNFKSKSTQTGK